MSIWYGPSVERLLMRQSTTYPDDEFCASLRGEHAQDAGTTSDVKNSLPLEQMAIVHDRRAVRPRPDAVLEHLLVDACGTDVDDRSAFHTLYVSYKLNSPKCA